MSTGTCPGKAHCRWWLRARGRHPCPPLAHGPLGSRLRGSAHPCHPSWRWAPFHSPSFSPPTQEPRSQASGGGGSLCSPGIGEQQLLEGPLRASQASTPVPKGQYRVGFSDPDGEGSVWAAGLSADGHWPRGHAAQPSLLGRGLRSQLRAAAHSLQGRAGGCEGAAARAQPRGDSSGPGLQAGAEAEWPWPPLGQQECGH